MVSMNVVWLSAGISSFIAGWLERSGVDEWIYIDVADQHPDSMRFIKDCEKLIDKEVKILRSDKYKDVEDVCRKTHMVNSIHGAACTGMLKKAVRKKLENEQYAKGIKDLTYIWGMDANERKRADGIIKNFPEFQHRFPLIERYLSKDDCHALAAELGLKRPLMYDLGYSNNNCVGCVKGGMWYWNKIRKDFPEVFEKRAKMERDLGHSCINGIYLDELDPKAGRKSQELHGDCSLMCFIAKDEI